MKRGGLLLIGAAAVVIGALGLALILSQTPMPSTGPLALVEPPPGSPQSRTEGVLEITDECVRLIHPDGTSSLVIWIRGAVTWDATDRSIAVVGTPGGGERTVRNGDAVALGGGGGPAATLESAGKWVSRPAETCEAEKWFLTTEVLGPEPG